MTPTEARELADRCNDASAVIVQNVRWLSPEEAQVMLGMRDFYIETRTALRSLADQVEALEAALVSFTKSDYIKKQHPKRYAAAIKALGAREAT